MTKVALVTGAAGGIGKLAVEIPSVSLQACVELLTTRGYSVIGVDVVSPKKEEINKSMCGFHEVDLRSPAAIAKLATELSDQHNALHLLVNNAGIGNDFTVETTTVEEWDRVLNVNARAPFLLVQQLLPLLRRGAATADGGTVVNVGSVHARFSIGAKLAYAASKAALVQLTRCMALSLAVDKIRVNVVNPGAIVTPVLTEKASEQEVAAVLTPMIPLHRLGRPEDVAKAIAFLASNDASYITGQELFVDGGVTAKLALY